MPPVSVLRIDLAKQLVHVVGMNHTGTMVWRKRLTRSGLMPLIAQLSPWSSAWRRVEAPTTGRAAFVNMGLW
jgi:hypothetical protein